jgi:EAL domain-containing protein (putative c-di-GMP-specific phosphodiesterase class I)
MYRAKAKGGSSYQFADEHMRQRAFDRLELEEQIRHALAADQFTVFYQPIVDLEKCTIVGLEALARWQHPERGLLTPDKFIDLAEETGLIVPLGEVVLRSVATSVADWVANTPAQKLRISVNLSAKQLRPELIPVVSACVNAIAPWTLCLEITESTLMEETLAAGAVLDELKGMGVEVSIDDFGTGFSSLSYLTRLQVDSLKIDRSFVWDLEGKPEAATVAQAIVSLGNGLRLQVIAEGIETETHRDWLVSMGCRYGQGYLFGKPESADRTRQLLEDEFAPRPWLPRPATAAVAAVRSRLGGVSETLAQGLSRPR